tara:strand:- start:2858 stop:4234 length:1377 start_codon:yes stop_codon:yes gene_type:complete
MRPSEKVDFSKFGNSFQENLAKLILFDRTYADQVGEVLDINYFETKALQTFVKLIYDYKEKYSVHPTLPLMASLVNNEIGEGNKLAKEEVRKFLVKVHTDQEVAGEEYIKDRALDFCKKQRLKDAIIKSAALLENSSFDEISELINEALKLGQNNDFGYDYVKDFEKRFELKARNPISTGWAKMDEISQGGLGSGELGVAIGGTGAGKSHLLVHLGASALKQGKTVIHYTLELSDTAVARRYDSCLTGVPLNDVTVFKDHILEKIVGVSGKLLIKEYATRSVTTKTIKNHLEKLKNAEITPDLILIDYADLIRPLKSYGEKRHDLETIYEDLRGTAQTLKCPLWTVSQTNRSGYNAELVTIESISEAFSKCFVADLIFTLSRTLTDKTSNGGRFFVAKNRFGPDGIAYPIYMDTSKVKINIVSQDVNTTTQTPRRTQEHLLKQKYKELMKGKNNGTNK